MPYVRGATEKIQRVLRSNNIMTTVKPVATLRQMLSKPKDQIPTERKTGVIYEIPCRDCDATYIGETGRSLKTRQKEHMACVRLDKCDKSALAEHANTTGHEILWDGTKIIGYEHRWLQRRWLEAIKIASNENSLCSNRDNGRIIPDNYSTLFKSS